jgi:hypothetical protein
MEINEIFIKDNDLNEGVIWEADEIFPIEPTLSGYETNDIPGVENAIVFGDPIALGGKLDFIQGFDNEYSAIQGFPP